MLIRVTRYVLVNPDEVLSVNYDKCDNCISICLNMPRQMNDYVVRVYPRNWLHRRIIYHRIMGAMRGDV